MLLLVRDRLTSGTTWHAAGLMATFGSTSQTSTELRKYTGDLYSRLEAETSLATGLKQCGLIEFAIEPGLLEEYPSASGAAKTASTDSPTRRCSYGSWISAGRCS